MKFVITRTSTCSDERPIDGAVQESFTRVDERTVDDPAKIGCGGQRATDDWNQSGVNHRIENGHIKRDFPGELRWVLEVGSLEDLMALCDREGGLVVDRDHWDNEVTASIEIYDTYRV